MSKLLFPLLFLVLPSLVFAGPELEPLMGHMTASVGIQIQVYSGGCTRKEQFHAETEIQGEVHRISFVRSTQDPCRAYFPYGQILSFSFDELGLHNGDQIEIANPQMPTQIMRLRIGG